MDVTGADGGTRTRNLLFTKQLLYQLSYVGATGRALPQKTLRRRGMIGPLAGSGQAWGSGLPARGDRFLGPSVGRRSSSGDSVSASGGGSAASAVGGLRVRRADFALLVAAAASGSGVFGRASSAWVE